MKIALTLEGVVEVLPLLLLCLNVVALPRYLLAFLSVVLIWGLWLAVSSLASEKTETLKRAFWESRLYRKVCCSTKRVYQEFEPFQVFIINFSFKASCISIVFASFEDDLDSQATFVLVVATISFYVARRGYGGEAIMRRSSAQSTTPSPM